MKSHVCQIIGNCVHQLVLVNIKTNIKAPLYWSFVREITGDQLNSTVNYSSGVWLSKFI